MTPAGVVSKFGAGIADSSPTEIAAGSDGNLWFTASGDRIGKIRPPGVVTEYGAAVTVTVSVRGKGGISGGGISCPARCKATIASGAKLTLTASAARGYRFAGWSGACTGFQRCTLRPKAAVKITAFFPTGHS